ncbi:DUF6074 family protein [Mesorhizobium sp. M0959]|uniref:DUF6074 family protein n=1 Tax=unclassified Mesorhizobium TaxID=325217 RepID=UPI003339A141
MSAFPLNRRRKSVEDVARVLEPKNLEDANAFWRSTAKTILVQLRQAQAERPTCRRFSDFQSSSRAPA